MAWPGRGQVGLEAKPVARPWGWLVGWFNGAQPICTPGCVPGQNMRVSASTADTAVVYHRVIALHAVQQAVDNTRKATLWATLWGVGSGG